MNGRCDIIDTIENMNRPCFDGECKYCPYATDCFFIFFTDDENTVLYTEGE